MNDLLEVRRVLVPRECADAAREHLRAAGERGLEGMALWAGTQQDTVFEVLATIVPRQTGSVSDSGLAVVVDADELFRLNVWLYENAMQLVAQLHSHPGAAYHSETDDTFPIMARLGGFSLVLPDFATRPFDLREIATYRLLPGSGWCLVPAEESMYTFVIQD